MSDDNALTAVRDDLKALLTDLGKDEQPRWAGFLVEPERFAAPAVFVDHDEPFLQFEGAPFGSVNVRHVLVLVARNGVNEQSAAELDRMLLRILPAIPDTYSVGEVDPPGRITVNGQSHPAVAIHLATQIRLPSF